ncbi:hypothetical protein N2W54_000335 [Lotmaria passim]
MPGKQTPPLPPRVGAATTRRAATSSTFPYTRRGPLLSSSSASSSQSARPGAMPPKVGPSSASSARSNAASSSPQPQPEETTTPACDTCVACLKASEDVARTLSAVLANTKNLFLDDVVHHYSGDEAWLRVLRSLGWTEEMPGERGKTKP